MSHPTRSRWALLAVLVVALAAAGLPARADDESESSVGALEVEVRPAITAPGRSILVQAEYDADDANEHGEHGDHGDEPDGDLPTEDLPTEDPTEGLPTEDPTEDLPTEEPTDDTVALRDETDTPGRELSVVFTVDFGDGSGPQPMMVNRASRDGSEARANQQHRYDEAGDYTITVTATPVDGEPVTTTVVVNVGAGSARLGGHDRFDTSARLSRENFPADGEAEAVLLARADHFADALASAPLALLGQAPVLLTSTASVPDATLEEIARALGEEGTVYLLGGESAISPEVATALTEMGYEVVRIAGDDRVDTAIQVARFLLQAGVDIDEVVLASAANFPDALAGAAYAAARQAPVLLTWPDRLDPRVAQLLTSLDDGVQVLVAGGEAAVSDAVVAEVAGLGLQVERLSGGDRFATSARMAERLFDDATAVVVATGANFPDALAGAAHAGRLDAPILLVGDTLPEAVRVYLEQRIGQITVVYVLGGEAVVPAAVLAEIEQLLGLS
ncbi:MAG TPA: cell wall-binding repeat-containing protein [Egibacteraceae bacterium]|nr:cell wall-binding repeat-containing protein [Egibacteraceae bacterium]